MKTTSIPIVLPLMLIIGVGGGAGGRRIIIAKAG